MPISVVKHFIDCPNKWLSMWSEIDSSQKFWCWNLCIYVLIVRVYVFMYVKGDYKYRGRRKYNFLMPKLGHPTLNCTNAQMNQIDMNIFGVLFGQPIIEYHHVLGFLNYRNVVKNVMTDTSGWLRSSSHKLYQAAHKPQGTFSLKHLQRNKDIESSWVIRLCNMFDHIFQSFNSESFPTK